MISILLLSWDRHEELVKSLTHNLKHIDYPYELLICDQGSKDRRVFEFLDAISYVSYFRKNSHNEGIGKSFNQLYLRSSGSHIALMSNDIIWPYSWGRMMVEYANSISNSGLIGIPWWTGCLPPISVKDGIEAHHLTAGQNRIFGPTLFRRQVVEEVGLFCEDFDVYGGEDSDFNERVNRAGFNSAYVPRMTAEHIGWDIGQDSEYRRRKDQSLKVNASVLGKRLSTFDSKGLKEPLPPPREPL